MVSVLGDDNPSSHAQSHGLLILVLSSFVRTHNEAASFPLTFDQETFHVHHNFSNETAVSVANSMHCLAVFQTPC